MDNPRHFKTGDFRSHASVLPQEAFGLILDNLVVASVDCMVVDSQGKMLLVKRALEPTAEKFWIVGGLMQPGETFEAAAQRVLEEKIKLGISETNRFKFLNVHSYVWARREQALQENGCHILAITMAVIITDEEVLRMQPNDAYSEVEWRQVEVVTIHGTYHPALRTCARDFLLSVQKIGK